MSDALTLERMRQDAADILHLDPAEIRDDDNLMELGLDSLRAMSLAMSWRQAGAAIEFTDLVDDVTLGRWWQLVQAAGQQ